MIISLSSDVFFQHERRFIFC